MNFEQIRGILCIILFIGIVIYYNNRSKKIKQKLNQMINENQEQSEKIKVIKSLDTSLTDNKKEAKGFLYFLLVLFLVFLVIITALYKNNFYGEYTPIILLLLFYLILFSLIIIKTKNLKKYIKKLLVEQYGDIKEDKKFCSLDINKKNNFCFRILKYKCIVNNYTEKRLQYTRRLGYRIKKVKNIFEYYYDLNALGVKNISNELLLEENVKNSIENLKKIKLIDVKILEDYLFVSKMTVLHGYDKKDVDVDIADVELFYTKIVKKILDNNLNKS